MSAYGEWCPKCGAEIVSVTRGIPSMGTCKNSHKTDRRLVLDADPLVPIVATVLTPPEKIRVAQDADGFWTCREAISGSPQYTRDDLAQASVVAALEAAATLSKKAGNCFAWQIENDIRALITARDRDALAAHVAAELAKARAVDAGMIYHAWCMGRDAAATAAHTAKPLNYAQLSAIGGIKAPQQVFSKIGAMTTTREAALEAALKEAGDVIQSYHSTTGIDLGDASRMPFYADIIAKIDAALSTPATSPQGYVEGLKDALIEIDNAPEPDHWVPQFQHVKDIATAALAAPQPAKTVVAVSAPSSKADHIAALSVRPQSAADTRMVPAWQLKQWAEQIDTLDPYAAMGIQAEIRAIISAETPAQPDKIADAAQVLLDAPFAVLAPAFDAMERLQGEGSDRMLSAALNALAENRG